MAFELQSVDKDLKRLRGNVVDLWEVVAKEMKKSIKYTEGDNVGLMSLAFVSKQLEHSKSIIVLLDNGQYRDALGLSRIMVEGYGLLDWANRDNNRASNWRAYAWVEQFRHLYDDPAYSEHRYEINSALAANCSQFLKSGSKGKSQCEITPEDYLNKWHREDDNNNKFIRRSLKEIFKETGLEKIYDSAYTDASGWIHWNPFQIAEAFQIDDTTVTYDFMKTKYLGAIAIIMAFHSLFGSAALLNDHFKLDLKEALDNVWRNYTSNDIHIKEDHSK